VEFVVFMGIFQAMRTYLYSPKLTPMYIELGSVIKSDDSLQFFSSFKNSASPKSVFSCQYAGAKIKEFFYLNVKSSSFSSIVNFAKNSYHDLKNGLGKKSGESKLAAVVPAVVPAVVAPAVVAPAPAPSAAAAPAAPGVNSDMQLFLNYCKTHPEFNTYNINNNVLKKKVSFGEKFDIKDITFSKVEVSFDEALLAFEEVSNLAINFKDANAKQANAKQKLDIFSITHLEPCQDTQANFNAWGQGHMLYTKGDYQSQYGHLFQTRNKFLNSLGLPLNTEILVRGKLTPKVVERIRNLQARVRF